MGKMKFKLAHVMPHAWFYKLREVGKPRSCPFKSSSTDTPRKALYTSPINHKAIDIPFPADTPKRSPHIEVLHPSETSPASDRLHRLKLPDNESQPPSIVLPCASAEEDIMSPCLEADNPLPISSGMHIKAGPAPSYGLTFDVRELERRLKALDWEDRRKYYTSPVFQSVAVPSPMIDGALHVSIESSHGNNDVNGSTLDTCAAHECTANVRIADGFSVDADGDQGRKPPLVVNVADADNERPSDGCVSRGEGLCGSIDESNRHSTSSSDTGLERGSSSMWERDVFSITSDGSEAFTATICPDEVEPIQKARHHFGKLRERMSPSLYGSARMERGFHDNNQLALDGRTSRFLKNRHTAGDVQDVAWRRRVSRASYMDQHYVGGEGSRESKGSLLSSYLHNGTACTRDVGARNTGNTYTFSIKRPLSPIKMSDLQYHEGQHSTNLTGSSRRAKWEDPVLHRSILSLPGAEYGKQVDSLSLPDDRNNSMSVQEDSGEDDRHSVHSRMSEASRFSYAKCKERLLSSRERPPKVEPPPWDAGARVQEDENLSNYAKFKLKQRGSMHGKAGPSNVSMYLDPGLFNRPSRRDMHRHAHKINNTGSDDDGLTADASRLHQDSKCVPLHRQMMSSYDSQSQHIQAREGTSSKICTQEEGPSLFKGTLRAVREKIRDLSSEAFTLPATGTGGGIPSSASSRTQVFDSFAMVKCSYDPGHDFKESMVEMIMEKGLHSSHDLVELLQCYLTLNADMYHDTIVKVFTEVWSEMFRHI